MMKDSSPLALPLLVALALGSVGCPGPKTDETDTGESAVDTEADTDTDTDADSDTDADADADTDTDADADACVPDVSTIPPTLSLACARTRILGEEDGDALGHDLIATGSDVDGDGLNDIAVTDEGYDLGADMVGAIHLMTSPPPGDVSVSTSEALIVGDEDGKDIHYAEMRGDLNSDGFGDLIVEAYRVGTIFHGPISGERVVDDADVKVTAGEYDQDEWIAGIGDMNANGTGDFAINEEGDIWLLDGATDGEVKAEDLAYADLLPETWTRDYCVDDDYVEFTRGGNLAPGGDLDGDGFPDLLVASTGWGGPSTTAPCYAGLVYVVDGPVEGMVDLVTESISLTGNMEYGTAGMFLSGAGDLNNDGYDDFLEGSWSLPAHVILGPVTSSGSLEDISLTVDLGEDGSVSSLEPIGDIDGDGYRDIATGDIFAADWAGSVYVFHGPITSNLTVEDASIALVGEVARDSAGFRMSGGSDVDGDGRVDLLVGAWGFRWEDAQVGAVYLMPGTFLQ